MATFGIVDDEAFGVGLPCGGTAHVFIEMRGPQILGRIAQVMADERPIAYVPAGPPRHPARLPDADELVTEWPHELLEGAQIVAVSNRASAPVAA